MQLKNSKVLCFGEALWDMLPSGPKPGGAPMNVAIHLNKFGIDVSMASRIGKDKSGDDLKAFIKKTGLSTNLIQEDESLPTSKVLVHLDANNNATYEICNPVAWDNIELTDNLKKEAAEAGVVIFGTLAARNEKTRSTLLNILENDCLKLVDINLRQPYDKKEIVEIMLRKADVVKLNDEEIVVISQWFNKHKHDEKSLLRWLSSEYKIGTVVMTRGEHGAIAFREGEFYEHSGYKVNAVDTVGSGDAFLAGFLVSLINGSTTGEALAFACATGALVATKTGGTPDYSVTEIEAIRK
jgi:fructokinase